MKRQQMRSGPSILCIEVWRDSHTEGAVGFVVSLPGREGTLQYRWGCQGGMPDDHQVEDIRLRLAGILTDALFLAGSGIQLRLESYGIA